MFCEVDGTKLSPAEGASTAAQGHPAPTKTPAPHAPPGNCDACGAEHADDGDGYCNVCGHKLSVGVLRPTPAPSTPTHSRVQPGMHLGGYVVRQASGDRVTGSSPDGSEVLLVLGERDALAHEADALARIGEHRSFPHVVDRLDDDTGPFLALSAPSNASRMLADVVQTRTVEETVAAIDGLLDLVAVVEAAGYAFVPSSSDLFVAPDGAVLLCRIRGARPIRGGERMDVRRVLESLGEVFLAPAILGPTRLVRLLAPSREPGDRTLDAARAAMVAVREDLRRAPRARAGGGALRCRSLAAVQPGRDRGGPGAHPRR